MSTTAFDFISAREFRESLERDYAEMRACLEAQAWKSVQVLAGSIVEALLIDYLASTDHPSRPNRDPLRLDLAEAIALCRSEKAIGERTGDLCSVIRSYRNLIHPGRVVRLSEETASAKSAQIAVSVVDLIVDDIASARRSSVGLTAEQVVSKVRRDENSLGILKHLVKEVPERQRERLLLALVPEAYFSLHPPEDPWDSDELDRLEGAFRVVFDSTTDDIRKKAVGEFVRVLREEDGNRVNIYTRSFFRPADLEYVAEAYSPMVKQHLLSQVPAIHTHSSLKTIDGIGPYLTPADVQAWLDPFMRTLLGTQVASAVKSAARNQLLGTMITTSAQVDQAIDAM